MMRTATSSKGELARRKYSDELQLGDMRTPFQHDKDRVIHLNAFRRLQYKTQVYVFHEGDLYRTRLTHSLEVAQIAHGIALQLGADTSLSEAIALAHDLGHAPFGHLGGETLGSLLSRYGIPFEHNVQSYRIVTDLAESYTDFKGLNLTDATLEGILRHCTYFDHEDHVKKNIPNQIKIETSHFWDHKQPIIEAQVVNLADSIAYATHDIEDALEVGLLEWNEFQRLLNKYNIKFVSALIDHDLKKARDRYIQINGEPNIEIIQKVERRTLSRLLINKLIIETVKESTKRINEFTCRGYQLTQAIRDSNTIAVALSPILEKQLRILLNEILFNHVYREPRVMVMLQKAKRILETLFSTYMEAPEALPRRTQAKLEAYYKLSEKDRKRKKGKYVLAQVVGDYISGMTDKYAMDTYQLLTQAYEKAL